MNNYKEYLDRKRAEYGAKFDPSSLNPAFVAAYESGERVTVEFCSSKTGEAYETKRGTIGVTTGWQPCFLLMLTKRSTGSSYTIGKFDRIIESNVKN